MHMVIILLISTVSVNSIFSSLPEVRSSSGSPRLTAENLAYNFHIKEEKRRKKKKTYNVIILNWNANVKMISDVIFKMVAFIAQTTRLISWYFRYWYDRKAIIFMASLYVSYLTFFHFLNIIIAIYFVLNIVVKIGFSCYKHKVNLLPILLWNGNQFSSMFGKHEISGQRLTQNKER